ncbi:hypothetical protein JC2156_15200 [Weissella koreensis KCTC 3621]|nr:hypothetical protein JC2156_15200 [Weissella koreensis KCTC 3621]
MEAGWNRVKNVPASIMFNLIGAGIFILKSIKKLVGERN